MSVNLDLMTPREMCAGLMRGDRVDMRSGYSPKSAALTAANYKQLDADAQDDLIEYAYGFANGIAEAIERDDPSARHGRYEAGSSLDYHAGLRDGRDEVGLVLYPTLPEAS